MISRISLKNFKAFQKLEDFEMKPITILCGINSCGKSSIIQSILLLKQTIESQKRNILLLNSKYVKLGTFENIIYNKDKTKTVEFNFEFEVNLSHFAKRRPHIFFIRSLITQDYFKALRDANKNLIFELRLGIKIKEGIDESKFTYLKPIVINHLRISIKGIKIKGKIYPDSYTSLQFLKKNQYKLVFRNVVNNYREDKTISGEELINIDRFIQFYPSIPDREVKVPIRVFRDIDFFLNEIFRNYRFLGPLREEPSRRYIYEDEVLEIGIKGENSAYLFLNEKVKKLSDHFFYNLKTDNFELIKKINLEQA
ncbi:hypothetical protein LCGC14_0735930, partial [marine sediment metagenome]